jgi:hypothetical protein
MPRKRKQIDHAVERSKSAALSYEQFREDLMPSDDLTMFLKAHLHIEHKVIELLELVVADKRALDAMRLTFSQRVTLCQVLGLLDKQHTELLKKLGWLRNKFAHEPGTRISKEVRNQIRACLPKDEERYDGIVHADTQIARKPLTRSYRCSNAS